MIINSETRSLTVADLPVLTAVHQTAFPDSAITRLGHETIRRYYHWLLTGPHPEAFRIGVFEGNQLLGFCFGGRFNRATAGFLRQNRFFLAWRVMTHPWLIANPLFRERIKAGILILRRLRHTQPVPSLAQQELANPSFGILAIATHPAWQGKGVGKQLMVAAERQALEKGNKQMHLTVHPDNQLAIQFYENLNWCKEQEVDGWQGRMVKELH